MRRPHRTLAPILALAAAVGSWAALAPSGVEVPEGVGAEAASADLAAPARLAATLVGRAPVEASATRGTDVVGCVRRDGAAVPAVVAAYRGASASPFEPIAWNDPLTWARRIDHVPDAPPAREATAGDDGAFRLAGLSRGVYRVVATGRDGARDTCVLKLTGEGCVTQDFALFGGGHRLRGRVTWADGRPFEGVVRALPYGDDRAWAGSSPGDPPGCVPVDGRYEIGGLGAGQVVLRAEVPGRHVAVRGPVWLPREEAYDVAVGQGTALEGRVLADDSAEPIPGAIVEAFGTRDYVRAVAGDDGAFGLLVPEGCGAVWARADGWSPAALTLPAKAPPPRATAIRMTRAGGVRGRVRSSADGSPVAGVTVLATSTTTLAPDPVGGLAVTAADGSYEILGLPAVAAAVTLRGAGWLLEGDERRVAIPRGRTVSMDLVATAGVAVEGRVLDESGSPVAAAEVVAFEGASARSAEASAASTTSGADGAYRLEGLAPGKKHLLRARAAGHGVCMKETTAPAPGAALSLDLPLGRARRVEVAVRESGAGPVSGAEVWAGSAEDGWAFAQTGADGRAALEQVGAAQTRLVVEGAGFLRWTASVPSDAGRETVQVVLHRPATLVGRVAYDDGRPAAGVRVAVTITAAGEGKRTGETDAAGAFRFEDLARGPVVLRIEDPRRAALREAWSAVESAVVTVEAHTEEGEAFVRLPWPTPPAEPERAPPEVVRLHVLDPDGQDVATASVSYQAGGSSGSAWVVTGWAEVPRGSESIVVSRAASASGASLAVAPGRCDRIPDGVSEFEIRLARGLGVRGSVLDEEGRPLADAKVRAAGEEASTDAVGAFDLAGFEPGLVHVEVTPPDRRWLGASADVPAGTSGVEFRLRRSATASVRVLRADGTPCPGASVLLSGPAVYASFETSPNGVARVSGGDPGATYALRVTPPDTDAGLSVAVSPWAFRDTDVRLAPACEIRGRVVDPRGRPVAGAGVSAVQEDGDYGGSTTDAEGRFAVTGLSAGRYEVGASVGHDEDAIAILEGPRVEAHTGDTDVRLTLDPGETLRISVDPRHADAPDGLVKVSRLLTPDDEDPADASAAACSASLRRGVASFAHAERGSRYAAWVCIESRNLCALLPDVRAGAEVRANLVAGLPVRGRADVPAGARCQVSATRQGVSVEGRIDATGAFEFRTLLPGVWSILVQARVRDPDTDEGWRVHAGSADVAAGAEASIAVR